MGLIIVHDGGMKLARLTTAAVLSLALGTLGCSGTNVKPVPAEELQQRIAQSVESELGDAPAVLCPAGIEAEVGAEAQCSISGGSEPLIATAKVTAVDSKSGEVKIAVSVAPDPANPAPSPTSPAPGEADTPGEDESPSPSESPTS
ncbi:protein of unknown function [Bowdeniella nasicola]|uniref:DUF4333 domain-containing protein n=2 Tax=Bowdeniella nasicola TaxID=208480 RepID=A0A1H3WAR5_9ACTO|nr:protein of unknown function [Bowdeniella nasicola]